MKSFSPALAAHLASGATTLCQCWRIVRGDGIVLGFTDHDRPVAFDGVEHEPASGLDASEAVAHAGLQVGGLEVAGALTSDRISAADLEAGLYDNARVETWLVNWAAPAERHLMRVGSIGEVRREDGAFTAEIRSLAHQLDQPQGRLFRFTCDADLGDARCGVSLSDPAFAASATVTGTDGRGWIRSAALAGRPDGLFTGGLVTFSSGANAGRRVEVDRHSAEGAAGLLSLWLPAPAAIAPGDGFTVTAGCDKRFETCRDRFANGANFRGFPHMPGNDVVLSYAGRD
ncbi:DUF2163 domain-containing protein [Faunimonas sp. B44]|uniref:DUF2163 domain-containing protein n=1 Tax=Faunimonas sp. B44 TaxID=3461493 RepID=UPI004043AA02